MMLAPPPGSPVAATPHVLLVDDHPLFCDGFAAMIRRLRPGWRLRCAPTAAAAEASIRQDRPDLVVIGLRVLEGEGSALLGGLASDGDAPPRLIMSGRRDEAARARACLCGASGYASKADVGEAIAAAMDAVLEGRKAFGVAVQGAAVPSLTLRQAQVLKLLNEGHGNKEIRYRLNIAERTVRAHLTELFQSLGAHSRMQALIRAREIGLVA